MSSPLFADYIPSRGQVAATLVLEVVRELTLLDLMRLADAPKGEAHAPPLKNIKARHHRMAQLIAMGKNATSVAIVVGSTPQRIYQHMKDPSFKELVAYYQSNVLDADFETTNRLQTKLQDVAETATELLAERLEEHASGEKRMSDYALIKAAEFAADRSVAPPKAAPQNTKTPDVISITFGNPMAQPKPQDDLKVIGASSTDESPNPNPESPNHERPSVSNPAPPPAPDKTQD